MGQYDRHVFVCTSGETCPTQGETDKYVKILRAGAQKAGRSDVRISVHESDLEEILTSHIIGGSPSRGYATSPA